MELTARPYLTAGIAVIGAGIIAAHPVAPPLPAITMPEVQLADFVAADLTDPIGVYSALVTNTFNSIADLGGHWLGNNPYSDAGYFIPLLTAALHPVQNFNAVIDAIGSEVTSGDPLAALGALVSAPGSIADAVINGYSPGHMGGLLGDTIVSHLNYTDYFPGLIGYFTDYAPQLLLQQLGVGDFLAEVTAPGSVASTLSALSPEGLLDGLNLGDLFNFDWLNSLVTMVLGALPF